MSFKSAATATAIVAHFLYHSCTVAADNTIHLVRASSKYKFHWNNRPIHIDTCASIRIRHTRKNSISAFQLPVSLYPGLFKGRESKRKSTTYHQAPYKYPINHLNISQEFRSVQNLNHLRNSAPTGSNTRLLSTGSSSVASPSPSPSPSIQMRHFNSVKSTQDEARRILKDKDKHVPHQALAITASSQTNGRGTNGRSWIGQTGNVFLTIAIPSDDLVIPLTLFPLQIGTLLTQRVSDMLNHKNIDVDVEKAEKVQDAKVTVKWPNDVLVNQKKIAGVLIESDQDHSGCYYYLVGIGINYKYAPKVNTTGSQRGRESTCICDYIPCINAMNENEDEDDATSTTKAMELGQNVARDVMDWVKLQKSWDGAADAIVPNWERYFECGTKLIMRDDPNQEVVTSVGIEKDGQLRVKGMNGVERLLCSDYLL